MENAAFNFLLREVNRVQMLRKDHLLFEAVVRVSAGLSETFYLYAAAK